MVTRCQTCGHPRAALIHQPEQEVSGHPFVAEAMPPTPPTPVLDAMLKVADDSQKIGDFLDWLSEQGIHLGKWGKDEYGEDALIPTHEGPSALLHRYFKIDPAEEERERRALLEWVRDPYGDFKEGWSTNA